MTEPRSKWHKPNWLGKPAVEMRADEAAYQDTQPIIIDSANGPTVVVVADVGQAWFRRPEDVQLLEKDE